MSDVARLPRYRAASRRGLQRRAANAFVLAVSILLVAVVVASVTLTVAHRDRDQLLNHLDPALEVSSDYLSGLLDQSSGARTYALTGDPTFRALYRAGVARADAAHRELSADLDTASERAALAHLDRSVGQWRADSIVPLSVGTAARAEASRPPAIARANVQLIAVRTDLRTLDNRLIATRRGAVDAFNTSLAILEGLLVAVLVALGFLLLALIAVLRRRVLRPLLRLGAASRRVAGGELDHVVPTAGPPEIAELGRDIESMRVRVVTELRASEEAHDEVVRQGRILEQREAELTRSNRDLEQFAYVASHDLQEPLRKVASFCQLLSERYEDQLDERGQQYIDFAVDGSKRMQALVNDLLAFSRVGRTGAGWVPVDLGQAASQAVSNLQRRISEAGGHVEIAPDLPVVTGDRALLVTLLQNLIGNGLKFRGAEPPVVTVAGHRAGDSWAVTVADNGIGIELRFRERVFVLFQRLHARDAYEGTGIGLALSRRIVEYHGGTIRVVPHDGVGTIFEFTLPVQPVEPAARPQEAHAS